MGDGMGRFSVSYNDSFDQELEPNANYAFVVNTQNNIIEISRTGTCPSCGKYYSVNLMLIGRYSVLFILNQPFVMTDDNLTGIHETF